MTARASHEPPRDGGARPRALVVGTAGHIDHGKSELVAALTGTHPDRLREEKERGITIDIGFANLELPDVTFSFIDVPGHERFIKNMLAGASGIDLVLLVVAADESVRPQTREHFHICRLLGLTRGVIALTKIDLVERDLLELVEADLRELTQGSFLEGAPIVPVSARTREGLPDLIAALREQARHVPARESLLGARLPVDRVFSVKGFGTVVTGTLLSGTVREGDDLELLTVGRPVKVRGIEVHGRPAASAIGGQRTALNLQGLAHQEMARGDVLAAPGVFEPVGMFDAGVALLEDAAAPLRDLSRVRVHLGTAEILARVRPLGAGEIGAGETGYAQFRLERTAVAAPGDRFIVRRYSPAATLGGGVVLDVFPRKHRRADAQAAADLRALDGSDLAARALWILDQAGERGLGTVSLSRRAGAPWANVSRALAPALAEGRAHALGAGPALVISASGLDRVRERAVSLLGEFHARNPLLPGCPLQELRTRLIRGGAAESLDPLLAEIARKGVLRIDKEVAALPGHRVQLGDSDAKLSERLAELFRVGGLNPPEPEAALAELGAAGPKGQDLLAHHLRIGTLRRLRDGRIFHKEALEELRRRLVEHRETSETIDIATFKDLAGVTRKNAIPLLEYFDETRVTLRRGSDRVILK